MVYSSRIVNTAAILKARIKNLFLQNGKIICTCLLASVILSQIFFGSQVRFLSTSYSISQFLPKTDPLLQREEHVKDIFGLSRTPGFLVTAEISKRESGTWFDSSRVKKIEPLFDRLATIKNVEKLVGIGNVEGIVQDNQSVRVGPLLKLTPANQRELRFLNDSLLSPALISKDARTLMIAIDTGTVGFAEITKAENDARKAIAAYFPTAQVQVGGVTALQAEMGDMLFKELRVFVALAFVISFFVLMAIFSSFNGIWTVLLMVGCANVMAIGGLAYLEIPFTVLSTTLPILVNITVLSIATHTLLRLNEDCEADGSIHFFHYNVQQRFPIVLRTLKNLFLPNFLAAFTTCIGFLTLMTIPVPVIRNYGVAVAGCVMATWLLVNIMMLAILPMMSIPRSRKWTSLHARWALRIIRYRLPVALGIGVITILSAVQGFNLNWSPRLFDDLPANEPTRMATERIDEKLGGVAPFEVVVEAKDSRYWTDPQSIQKLESLLVNIRSLPVVGSANSISDFLLPSSIESRQNKVSSKLAGHHSKLKRKIASATKSHAQAPTLTRQAIAEKLFIFSMSPEDPMKNYMTSDGKSIRIGVRMHDAPSQDIAATARLIESATHSQFPGTTVSQTGMAVNAHILNSKISRELIFGFWQALGLIAVLLVFVFRSVKWSLVACLPNFVSPAVLLAAMSFSSVPIKPGIALVFSIALGLSFTNTVYLMERIRRQKGTGVTRASIRKAFYQESNPCVVSTLVIFAGFLVFLGSYFSLNRYFGAFMLLSILGGLVGDLIFLPALVSVFPKLLSRKERAFTLSPATAMVAACLMVTSVSWSSTAIAAAESADQVLKKAQRQIASVDEVASVKLSIVESDGSKKDRELVIKRKTGSKNFVLARLEQPSDLRGVSFLSVYDKGKEDQWLYLPSSKQTRRIVGSNKDAGFLGSEITYEDLSASQAEGSKTSMLKDETLDGRPCSVVETRAKKGKSSYAYVRTWVTKDQYLAMKAEYYDWHNKLVKRVTFDKYKQYGKGTWRAQEMHVVNLKNKRGTDLLLTHLAVNKGISDHAFSVQALEVD